MQTSKNKKKGSTSRAITQLSTGNVDMAPAWVGMLNTGTPVINVVFPKNNLSGVDYSEVKRALRTHYVKLIFWSPNGESINFSLDEGDVQFHSLRPENRFAGPLHKIG